ncbi:hypothetical protein [Cytobacillus depressus]|uniref:hypothetical protein n=1 Tax=Cytobacillus depressus TaxID=1602942 RepID=UPI001478DE66|nr:hypothetical protein [Cytobacillus depressus]
MNSNMIIEDFMISIFDSLYDGIFATDTQGVCEYVNQDMKEYRAYNQLILLANMLVSW